MRARRYSRRAGRVATFDRLRSAADPAMRTPYRSERAVRRATFYGLAPAVADWVLRRRRHLSAIAGALLAIGLILWVTPTADATGAPSVPRAVALQDAERAPDYMRYVLPHRCATLPLRLALQASDVSAYAWDGLAIGAQRWHPNGLEYVWRHPAGGSVRFDGRTFCARTRVAVLVAAWKG